LRLAIDRGDIDRVHYPVRSMSPYRRRPADLAIRGEPVVGYFHELKRRMPAA